jgi:hypothetical protein
LLGLASRSILSSFPLKILLLYRCYCCCRVNQKANILVSLLAAEPSKEKKQEGEGTTEPPRTTSTTEKTSVKDQEEYQALRTVFDNNWQQLQAIVKGSLEPIIIHCEKDVEGITEDAIKAIEGAWIFCHTFSPMIKP